MTDEKHNAKQFPQKYYARHMQPGIAKYADETILVDTGQMQAMMPSAIGKPVYVLHNDVILETLKEDMHGIISGSFYNDLDGWAWFEFMAIDDIAFQAIANKWSVSNAYIPTESGPAGEWHNCPYDRQILNGEFTHLAIVPDPRYEGACIFSADEFKSYQAALRERLGELQNSKSQSEGKKTMKLWKNKKEEVTTVDEDTMVELQNGKSASVKEMVAALELRNAEEKDKAEEEKKNSQKVMVNGAEMTVDELMNAYCALKNEKDEEEKKNAESEKEDEEGEKKNSKDGDGDGDEVDHFKELKNAHTKQENQTVVIETSMDKIERGRQRYGSAK